MITYITSHKSSPQIKLKIILILKDHMEYSDISVLINSRHPCSGDVKIKNNDSLTVKKEDSCCVWNDISLTMQLQSAIVRGEAVRCADYKYMVLDCVPNLGTMETEREDRGTTATAMTDGSWTASERQRVLTLCCCLSLFYFSFVFVLKSQLYYPFTSLSILLSCADTRFMIFYWNLLHYNEILLPKLCCIIFSGLWYKYH